MCKDLKFDIYAMTNPKTSEDLLAILREALIELENTNEILNKALDDLNGFDNFD
jgi:hypothetical protein